MRKGEKVAAGVSALSAAFLSVPEVASATHNIAVVGGPAKFDFALLILMAAPYLIVGTFALVMFRRYRSRQ